VAAHQACTSLNLSHSIHLFFYRQPVFMIVRLHTIVKPLKIRHKNNILPW